VSASRPKPGWANSLTATQSAQGAANSQIRLCSKGNFPRDHDVVGKELEMPRKGPGPSVKDKELYESLRDEGNSKEKSARIANAAARTSRAAVGRKGARAGDYEDMTKQQLYLRAKRVGIEGRSRMSKGELISALRNH